MDNKEFNLLWEPWIRVRLPDCTIREVSIEELFCHAEQFTDLAGELPTQDIAVLRLLLAVLHTVFYYRDTDGEEDELETSADAIRRWKTLWQMGKFPEKPILAYLEQWKDNFWLFHPERPFWQVPSAKNGTEYTPAKLNGELSESSNKLRLFPVRSGTEKDHITYAEAARWLLYVNAFDDTSAKPKGKDLPSVGAGWLGKCGLISAVGDNLFKTLMLNFVLTDDNGELWDSAVPVWELSDPPEKERVQIAIPHDQAALLTLQSRRLLLKTNSVNITGYSLLGGDFFDKKDAFSEQMTVWSPVYDKKKTTVTEYQPKRHDRSRQMWRDFSTIAASEEGKRLPGIVRWNTVLKNKGILNSVILISYRIASVQYGDKDFFASDIFSDTLSFHLGMMTELGKSCLKIVTDEIQQCDTIAWYIGTLARELDIAAGNTNPTHDVTAKEQFYYRIDTPFRKWLCDIDPDEDVIELGKRCEEWRKTARTIALAYGRELIEQSGPAAFIGRNFKKDSKDTERHYSAPEAYNHFLWQMKNYGKTQKGDETV